MAAPSDKVWLLDLSDERANDWLTVNHFTVIEGQHKRRPEVVVNSLPSGVIQLKNAS